MIPGFLENRRKDLDKIQAAVAANDFETLKSIGHTLKGVGGGYGFHYLSELGKEIETAAKNNSADDVTHAAQKMLEHLDNIVVEFE